MLNPHGRLWSAQAPDGRVILTIWNNQGLDDTEVRYVGGRDVLRCVPGAWVAEGPGKRWLDDARNCMTSGIPAEVIHLRGRRTPAPSHVRIAFADDALYAVKINRVEADGTVEGEFMNREDYERLLARMTRGVEVA